MLRRAALLACVFVLGAAPQAHALDKIITVTGEAAISVAPDLALVRAGVVTRGKTARDASEANNKQMTAVLAALKAQGVADADIQTSRLSIQPIYEQNRGPGSAITGFSAINQVAVKLRDLTLLPAQLDRMVAAGANELSGVEFSVADPTKALDKVRGDAVKDAQRKAAMLAEAAGGKVGRALTINEGARSGGPFSTAMVAQRGAPVPVAAGEEILRTAVTVTYEFAY